jgi:hypothetical protein
MKNGNWKYTSDKVDFVKSFSEINRIIAISELISMCKDQVEANNNLDQIIFAKRSITAQDIFQAGFDSDNPKWLSIIRQIIYVSIKQMFDELIQWVNIYKGNSSEILHVINPFKNMVEQEKGKLTYQFIHSEILTYNKNLGMRSLEKYNQLKLDQNELPHEYMRAVNYMFETLDECFNLLDKQIDIKIESMVEIAPKEVGIMIPFKLRWNQFVQDFDEYFDALIDDGIITLSNGEKNTAKIKSILESVFEKVNIDIKQKKTDSKISKIHLRRESFSIPDYLYVNGKPKEFLSKIKEDLVDNSTIFVEVYRKSVKKTLNNKEGESPDLSVILHKLFLVPKNKAGDGISVTTFESYLKDNTV